jgi:hypothetical protein
MRDAKRQEEHSELKKLVAEAVQSLAKLDAARLEELALRCQALNRDLAPARQQVLAVQARASKREMAALAQMLEATGANVAVLNRLRELRTNRMEYEVVRESQVSEPEVLYGLH